MTKAPRLKRFGNKWEVSSTYAVPCQFLVDIARHEGHSEVYPHAERADGQFIAMDVGEFVVAGHKRTIWRRHDQISQ